MALAVQDIFSRSVSLGGVFTADGATLSFDQMAEGLLTQTVSWGYQQQITRIYEVASADVYLVAGRTQGNAQIDRVMGPTALAEAFFETYGDVCNAATNTLSFSAESGCPGDDNDSVTITLNNIVIESYSGSVQAQQMVVGEQMKMIFLSLDYAVAAGS